MRVQNNICNVSLTCMVVDKQKYQQYGGADHSEVCTLLLRKHELLKRVDSPNVGNVMSVSPLGNIPVTMP